jgi:hypothetical protein
MHTVRYRDLPAGIAQRFEAASFDAHIQEIERETAKRERDGEFDHLIYYALQSQIFTGLPRIEPALSARELVEVGTVPQPVQDRLRAFLRAMAKSQTDERLRYFARLLSPDIRTLNFLEEEYRRGMRFLYEKEFQRRDHVYETRGHSTDTQVEANYAVWNGLSVLREFAPEARIRRVLIIGPGLDFAPRTALFDRLPPQSFQPYAVADALLSLGLARRESLTIDCADINSRVIEFINRFPQSDRFLRLYSEPGDADYNRYFHNLGGTMGTPAPNLPTVSQLAKSVKTVRVDADVAREIHASKLNIVTGRWPASYDLVIVTNVLVYFNADELALALANIAAMLPQGGWLLHNELRGDLDELSAAAGLEPVQARTVRVSEGRRAPLFDAFAIYRRH